MRKEQTSVRQVLSWYRGSKYSRAIAAFQRAMKPRGTASRLVKIARIVDWPRSVFEATVKAGAEHPRGPRLFASSPSGQRG